MSDLWKVVKEKEPRLLQRYLIIYTMSFYDSIACQLVRSNIVDYFPVLSKSYSSESISSSDGKIQLNIHISVVSSKSER